MDNATALRENQTANILSEPPWVSALHALWTGRGRLLKWSVAGLAISVIAAFVIPVKYTSSVDLMPPDSSVMNLGLMAAMTGVTAYPASAGLATSLLNGKTQGGTFIGIVESRAAEDDLINRFDLRRVYHVRTYLDARKTLSARTYVSEDRKSGIITISVEDNDRYRARDLASAYVDELDKLSASMNTSSAHRERVFLEGRLKTVKQDLDSVSLQLSQFSSRNATLNVQDQGRATLDATARLQGQLIAAQSELEGLKAAYSDGNVRVREARARVEELQHDLSKIGGTNAGGTDPGSPADSGGQLLPSLRQIPLLGYTYLDLYRRAQIQEVLYETLTKQYELAKIEEAKEIPTVKILDPAQIPEKKSFPPRTLVVVLGVFFATAIATCLELTTKWWLGLEDSDPLKSIGREIMNVRKQTGWSRRLGLNRDLNRDLVVK
jgi:capsule polysaccharide export protein KpsE/RkpR